MTLTLSTAAGNYGTDLTTGNADISGALNFTVVGGNINISGGTSYTGNTTVNGGVLVANFNGAGTVKPTILLSTTNLFLGSGTFQLKAKNVAGDLNTQTLASVTLTSGASVINNTTGASVNSYLLNLNNITRNTGATVDFALPNVGNFNTTTANFNGTPVGGQQTILGGWATANSGTSWAVSGTGPTAGNITALTAFDTTPNFTAGQDEDAVPDVVITPAPGTTINSLRFNTLPTATGYTFTPTAGDTLTIATGGFLVTSTVGAFPVNFDTGGLGKLTSGNGTDLIVNQGNTTLGASVTIGSQITGAIGLTKTGAGTLILTNPTSNYTGATYITGGILSVTQLDVAANPSTLGTPTGGSVAANLFIDNATLQYSGSSAATTDRLFTVGNTGKATLDASGTGSGTVNFSNTGAIAFNSTVLYSTSGAVTGTLANNAVAATLTFTGINTGINQFSPLIGDVATLPGGAVITTSVVKTGVGTWQFNSANTYSGGTTISAGTLVAGNTTGSATGIGLINVNQGGTLAGPDNNGMRRGEYDDPNPVSTWHPEGLRRCRSHQSSVGQYRRHSGAKCEQQHHDTVYVNRHLWHPDDQRQYHLQHGQHAVDQGELHQ